MGVDACLQLRYKKGIAAYKRPVLLHELVLYAFCHAVLCCAVLCFGVVCVC